MLPILSNIFTIPGQLKSLLNCISEHKWAVECSAWSETVLHEDMRHHAFLPCAASSRRAIIGAQTKWCICFQIVTNLFIIFHMHLLTLTTRRAGVCSEITGLSKHHLKATGGCLQPPVEGTGNAKRQNNNDKLDKMGSCLHQQKD